MCADYDVSTGIGLRHVRVALRDEDGTILVPADQPVATAYNGRRAGGALALTLTIPEPQRVTARGDDRAYHTFILPPTEKPTGELRVSKSNLELIAMLTGTKKFGVGPAYKVGLATDAQGQEPELILWGCRQAIDSEEGSGTFGRQIWQTYFLLNALGSVRPATMEDAAVGELTYSLVANDSGVDELGREFTVDEHGFTKAAYLLIVTDGKFMLDSFLGDGIETDFTLSQEPEEGGVIVCTVDGVEKVETTHWTRVGKVVTFLVAPADGAKILFEYEYAATAQEV